LAAHRDTVLENVAREDGTLQDGLSAILPVLARLCSGEISIADSNGRCLRRVDRHGTVFPVRDGAVSPVTRAVSRSGRAEWEEDEASGVLRVAFPVGDRILEIVQNPDSKTAARPVRLGTLPEFGAGFEPLEAGGDKTPAAGRGFSALAAKYCWDDIIGDGPAIAKAIVRGKAAARCNAPVFLIGESGTGKELFAQAIHNASARRRGPFIAINCSTLPEGLVDSMLFGYMDGTFTGARKGGRPGVFEQCDGGTLLLDEITEINVEIQAKLLRVIQEREVCRIGSVKPIPVDIRIIVTSNRDLHRHMREGLFREDLYYRLNVIDIHLPPLRDRREDIPAIVSSMIGGLNQAGGLSNRKLHPAAVDWLVAQSWPGNVRELRNVLERAINLAEGDVLLPEHFTRADEVTRQAHRAPEQANVGRHLCDRVAHAEEASILDALHRHSGHRGKTAAELGISVTTLWRRLRRISGAPSFAMIESHL
jgi:sigma-54 dependent transcriptional regulator, acetoin dehydrogenase operon transcriptional activator AcoR